MIGRGRRLVVLVALGAALGPLAGCSDAPAPASSPSSAPSPSGSDRTLTPLTLPPSPPPTGRLYADLRQSSRDAAAGRMQVWIRNDTLDDLDPIRLTYADGRLRRPLPATRLRLDPARSERGYPITLPLRPRCARRAGDARLVVETRDGRRTIPVADDTDIVARQVETRCLLARLERVATLRFADRVPVDRPGEGSIGTLSLRVRPSGRPGHRLTLDTVAGTPLLSAVGAGVWSPDLSVSSTDPPTTLRLPVHPARCDEHAFMEAGGATAFRVRLHLDGEPGELIVRMSPRGATAAIDYARDACGLTD